MNSDSHRVCPICNCRTNKFLNFGINPREDAKCPQCGSLERHRFLWIYLVRKSDFFDGKMKRILHIAPEQCFETIFRKQFGGGYLTADLCNQRAMVKMDITNIEYPNETFDVILCSHVLEHVKDDKKALSELYRVLKRSGWAILMVPITAEKTYEDDSIIGDRERLEAFGQKDHVRRYGHDFVDRILNAGFGLAICEVKDISSFENAREMGLTVDSGTIFHCSR